MQQPPTVIMQQPGYIQQPMYVQQPGVIYGGPGYVGSGVASTRLVSNLLQASTRHPSKASPVIRLRRIPNKGTHRRDTPSRVIHRRATLNKALPSQVTHNLHTHRSKGMSCNKATHRSHTTELRRKPYLDNTLRRCILVRYGGGHMKVNKHGKVKYKGHKGFKGFKGRGFKHRGFKGFK
ncbi:hypothetical protein DYB32_009283 [Aphanomyces invadans]|uniref:Uncharacterized protein n=1 Tax=Aphanomyces invadans TaxID=157072 RepID=A0A418AIS0_9STRA|nr:hypothetical protein DYB32_009283 [Aphanomyces invadans]